MGMQYPYEEQRYYMPYSFDNSLLFTVERPRTLQIFPLLKS